MVGELNESQIEELLRAEVIGRLGCQAEGLMYIVPISYVYADGYLYAHSGLGMKIEMMRTNPQVCFQTDHVDDLANWRSVILWGTYEELDGKAAEEATALLVQRLAPLISGEESVPPHPWNAHGDSPEHILHRASRHGLIYRIKITEKSGRYEKR